MVTDVRTVDPDTSIADMATLMARYSLRRVIVVDQQKNVVGVVSQRDTLRMFLVADKTSGSVTTSKVSSLLKKTQPITVTPDVPLVKAAVVLAANKIGCLPVVSRRGKLMGILSVSDLLKHVTGGGGAAQSEVETGFEFYAPVSQARENLPAFIRRVNGDLVVPLKGLDEDVKISDYALLGYDEGRGQILIKFVEGPDKIDDAIKVKLTKDQAVIPASGFVVHFSLDVKTAVFDVAAHVDGTSLVLSPRSKDANLPGEGDELH